MISKRTFLKGTALATGMAVMGNPLMADAALPTQKRLVMVFLKGGADSLSVAPPLGDSNYALLRGSLSMDATDVVSTSSLPDIVPSVQVTADELLLLDNRFALNPWLPYLHRLYKQQDMLVIHGVGSHYDERSHFETADIIFRGTPRVKDRFTGWLYHLTKDNTDAEGICAMDSYHGLVHGNDTPFMTWNNRYFSDNAVTALNNMAPLYALDPELAPFYNRGLSTRGRITELMTRFGKERIQGMDTVNLMRSMGRLLVYPDGYRYGVIEVNGFDTHQRQGTLNYYAPINNGLRTLNNGLQALIAELAPVWKDTLIVVFSEFGRTVRPNASGGTDHGRGGVMFLLGGNVKGARVLGNLPILSEQTLSNNRDVPVTTDIRSVFKGALMDHLGVSRSSLEQTIFPSSGLIAPMAGLLG
jgi:uncharacterized protein (DUF1501 family)